MSASPALLDVNVLVALFDPDHIHHEAAHGWFAAHRRAGWATCPLTENGVVRILANAAYNPAHLPAAEIRKRLDAFCRSGDHAFWDDNVSLRDERLFSLTGVRHGHVTDVYLVGLAVRNLSRLATFDRGIPWRAVVNATSESVLVIPA